MCQSFQIIFILGNGIRKKNGSIGPISFSKFPSFSSMAKGDTEIGMENYCF
jgi:hypothetical protein